MSKVEWAMLTSKHETKLNLPKLIYGLHLHDKISCLMKKEPLVLKLCLAINLGLLLVCFLEFFFKALSPNFVSSIISNLSKLIIF